MKISRTMPILLLSILQLYASDDTPLVNMAQSEWDALKATVMHKKDVAFWTNFNQKYQTPTKNGMTALSELCDQAEGGQNRVHISGKIKVIPYAYVGATIRENLTDAEYQDRNNWKRCTISDAEAIAILRSVLKRYNQEKTVKLS
jgi:hypothetical protein